MPTDDLRRYGRTEPLISDTMMKNITGQVIYQLVVIFIIFFVGKTWLIVMLSEFMLISFLIYRMEPHIFPTDHHHIQHFRVDDPLQ